MSVKVTHGTGFQQQLVKIIELLPDQTHGQGGPLARCQNPKTHEEYYASLTQRHYAAWPQIGEYWVLSRNMGPWDLTVKITPPAPPAVTGSVATGSGLASAISSLDGAGFVQDQTTAYSEDWQTPAYAAHWADANTISGLGGGHGLRYCLVDGGKTCWLYGLVAASTGAATTITTLASGYYPTVTTGHGPYIKVNGATITSQVLAVNTSGLVIVAGPPANGDTYLINTRIPLGTLP